MSFVMPANSNDDLKTYQRECVKLEQDACLLKNALNVVSRAALGQDRAIDYQLGVIKEAIKQEEIPKDFRTSIREMEDVLRQHIEESKQNTPKVAIDALMQVVEQYCQLCHFIDDYNQIRLASLDCSEEKHIHNLSNLLSKAYQYLSTKLSEYSISSSDINLTAPSAALLQAILTPPELHEKAAELHRLIRNPINIEEITFFFSTLSEVVERSVLAERKEYNTFLKGIAGRFDNFKLMVTDQVSRQEVQKNNSNQLQNSIEQSVTKINKGIGENDTITKVAPLIEQHLAEITSEVVRHQKTEQSILAKNQMELIKLKNEINYLKEEADRLKSDLFQTQKSANTDKLTGLSNRRAFDEQCIHIEKNLRKRIQPYCIAIMDIDRFKSINDNFGHLIGDKVLTLLGKCLQKHTRSEDSIYRFGGEEFVIIFNDTEIEQATQISEKLRGIIERLSIPLSGQEPLKVTVSIGLAKVDLEQGVERTLATADEALYMAKDSGRNCIKVL